MSAFPSEGLDTFRLLGGFCESLDIFSRTVHSELYFAFFFFIVYSKNDSRNGYARSRKETFPSLAMRKLLCKNCDLAAGRQGLTWKQHTRTQRKELTSPLSLSSDRASFQPSTFIFSPFLLWTSTQRWDYVQVKMLCFLDEMAPPRRLVGASHEVSKPASPC